MAQLGEIIGQDFDYRLIQTPAEELDSTIRNLEGNALCIGLNVTVPHKVGAYKLVQEHHSSAESLGATNCLVRGIDGCWEAHNTDGIGCRTMIEGVALDLVGKPAWVIGAGGAAAAAVHVLLDMGVSSVHLWNRSRDRAQGLQNRFGARVFIIEEERMSPRPELILNATSLGLGPEDRTQFELQLGASFRALLERWGSVPCLDMVYSKEEGSTTAFLQWISSLGGQPVGDGKIMLIAQAVAAVNLWFGSRLNVPETTGKISF